MYKYLVDGMTWSYSRIGCFEMCRYKWFMKYICNCSGKEMFYASYGSFIHKLLERYYKGELKKDDLLPAFITGFSDNVKGERPSDSIVSSYITKGCEYFRNFERLPFHIIGVEKEIKFKIGNREFVGSIDLLGEKDGEIYIIDNKSRDLKPRSKRGKPTLKDLELDSMLKQLYLYSTAIKSDFGKYPKALCFNCFKSNTFIEEPFVMSDYENAQKWALEMINKIRNTEDFYPSIEFFQCKNLCELQDECEYF